MVGDAIFIRLNMLAKASKIAKEEDEQWVNNTSSRLNSRNYGFLIWNLINFNLVPTLSISFN